MNILNTLMLHFTLCKTSNIPIKCENFGFIVCLFLFFPLFLLIVRLLGFVLAYLAYSVMQKPKKVYLTEQKLLLFAIWKAY